MVPLILSSFDQKSRVLFSIALHISMASFISRITSLAKLSLVKITKAAKNACTILQISLLGSQMLL